MCPGDMSVAFSDVIIKINKRNKMQERILLITEAAVYNIDPGSYKVKRRIDLSVRTTAHRPLCEC